MDTHKFIYIFSPFFRFLRDFKNVFKCYIRFSVFYKMPVGGALH